MITKIFTVTPIGFDPSFNRLNVTTFINTGYTLYSFQLNKHKPGVLQ